MNQAYLTVKKNKRILYCDYFVLGQIVEASTPPQDMSTYTLKENELKVVRPKYNAETWKFLGLYETVGYSVVRGSTTMVTTRKNSKFFIRRENAEFLLWNYV